MYLNKWLGFIYNHEIIKYRFLKFLSGIKDECNNFYYLKTIHTICTTSNKRFIISFFHIVFYDPILAIWITDEPRKILKIFHNVINELIKNIFHVFSVKKFKILIGIRDFPAYSKFTNLNKNNNNLFKIKGTVVSVTDIYSKVIFFKIICLKCLELQKIFPMTLNENTPIECFICKSRGPFQVSKKYFLCSEFQKISVNEMNFKKNYQKQVMLKREFIDKVIPGEEVEITCILKYKTKFIFTNVKKFAVFLIFFDANFIENYHVPKETFDSWEKKFIIKIYKKKKIFNFIVDSFLPSLLIGKDVKIAILLSLFGGKKPTLQYIHYPTIKENVNILILGEYNTFKTYILKYIRYILPKFVYTLGHKIQMKLLTARLKFDELIEDWIIEGGMLVVSDGGYLIINKIDLMDDTSRRFLFEAINQKKIYIIKKNKINYFNTRCSLIASVDFDCNLDAFDFLKNNFKKKPIFSLFDLMCTTANTVNLTRDSLIANFFLNKYEKYKKIFFTLECKKNIKKKKESICCHLKHALKKNLIEKFVSKYINYTRHFVSPEIKQDDQKLILDFYKSMQVFIINTSNTELNSNRLELLLLLIKSSSRIHLRNIVSRNDIRMGIYVILKFSIRHQLHRIRRKISFKFKLFLDQRKNDLMCVMNLLDVIIKKEKKKYLKKTLFENFCNLFHIRNSFLKKFYFSKVFIKSKYKLDVDKAYIFIREKKKEKNYRQYL